MVSSKRDRKKVAAGVPAFSTEPQRRYLTEEQLAERLNMSVKWCQNSRWKGGGIPFSKFGSAVRYAIADVEKYETERRRSSTSDAGGETAGSGTLCNLHIPSYNQPDLAHSRQSKASTPTIDADSSAYPSKSVSK